MILGLDIGGANLKAADGRGRAVQVPFALWKHPERLAAELQSLAAPFAPIGRVALTMTGELCDCFESKPAGVRHIIEHTRAAFPDPPIDVWTTDGVFASADEIANDPRRAAAANWLALASFAGRYIQTGLLIDLGSTTCDIVPLHDGRPIPRGRTDSARLASGELVYCGVRRTPLCAIFGLMKAAEWFATTEDVYVGLGSLPEAPERTDTADGRPVTKRHAFARLARMNCEDAADVSTEVLLNLALDARDRQVRRIAESVVEVSRRLPRIDGVVAAGAGEFLVPRILHSSGLGDVPCHSLTHHLGPDLSIAACAHAVAVLAGEAR